MNGHGCRSAQEGFGEALASLAGDSADFLLCVSTQEEGFLSFAEAFPDQFVRTGSTEEDLVVAAAGLSLAGFRVVVASTASFLVGRAYDRIRNLVALPRLPLCLVGSGSGFSRGDEGAPYQMLEDLALMRALPGMAVVVPSDAPSARRLAVEACRSEGPVYLRLGDHPRASLYGEDDADFALGEGRLLRSGDEVTLCACGVMVHEALRAAEILAQQGLSPEVIDCYSVKPLPERLILSSVRRTGCCVVAEEHGVVGGLCGAVAERVSQRCPVPLRFVTAGERFGQSGTTANLQEYYGLTYKEIVGAAAQAWAMRRR